MNSSSVKEIEALLMQMAEATRHDDKDRVLANHTVKAIIFDVLAPLQYRGRQAYRQSFDEWQPPFAIPCLFEFAELTIQAEDEVGFAHCLIHCGGTLPDGVEVKDTVRATFCFVKEAGAWCFAHQHVSSPMVLGE